MALNNVTRPSWWELASAGTITCGSLTALSFLVPLDPARALPIYSGGGAVNVDGVVPGANASIRVTADRGLVRWQDFSVQAGERFRIEGNARQSILNVVTGPEASRIGGVVESGPRFLLANPNGIEVLGTGQIVAPSTWLTTGRVREDDWLQQQPARVGAETSYPHIQLDRRTAINLAGIIEAEDGGRGGEVTLLAHDIELASTARLMANGAHGGGTIHVGGQAHGLGPQPTASRVTVAEGAQLQASATVTGDGGQVVVWSEDHTRFDGQIAARGGSQGGHGGFVEVSGRDQLDFRGLVDTMAPQGVAGMLLLDPYNLTISNNANQDISSSTGPVIEPSATGSVLSWATIKENLQSADLLIQTTGSAGAEAGNITIAAASPDLRLATSRTLTFKAAGDILINNGIVSTNGQTPSTATGSLVFIAGSGKSVTIGPSLTISANDLSIKADAINFNGGKVNTVQNQNYDGATVVGAATSLTGKDIVFTKAVTGAPTSNLTISSSGTVDLSNGLSGLQNLKLGSAGGTTKIGKSITTTGTQSYDNPVLLQSDTTLKSTGIGSAGNIVFSGTVNGASALTASGANGGSIVFNGVVGGLVPLTAVTASGSTLSLGNITSTGPQSYFASAKLQTLGTLKSTAAGQSITLSGSDNNTLGQVSLIGDTSILTNGGPVTINASVEDDGTGTPSDLTVSAGGANIIFQSSIGGSLPPGAVSLLSDAETIIQGTVDARTFTSSGGTGSKIVFNGGAVTTTGNQAFGNSLELGQDTTLTNTADYSSIQLHAVYSKSFQASNLTIVNTGADGGVQFYGDVGQGDNKGLGAIIVNAVGTTSIGDPSSSAQQFVRASSVTTDANGSLLLDLHNGEIITSGSQSYGDLGGVTLGSNLTLTTIGGSASLLAFAGKIDASLASTSAPDLTLDLTGTATFNAPVGASAPLGRITIDNSYGTRFASSLTADSLVFQAASKSVPPATAGANYLEFLGDLTLTSSLEFNPSQAGNYQPAFDVSLLGLTNRIGGVNGQTIFDNKGLLTIGRAVAKSSTTFEGGVMASQVKISLAGLIQAGQGTDGAVVDFDGSDAVNPVADGFIELRHDATTRDPVELRGRVVKLSGTVDSAAGSIVPLTIDTRIDGANGRVFLAAEIGGKAPLASLTTLNGQGTLSIDSPSIITQAGQSFAEASTTLFGHDLTATSTKGGTIAFAGSLDVSNNQTPVSLSVITDGIARFSGAIGTANPLKGLSTANLTTASVSPGSTELKGGVIRTVDDQSFGQPVSLGADSTLTSTNAGTIRFADAVNGSQSLSVATDGAITFSKGVGVTTPLTSLTTLSATGTTTLQGGSISTTGAQSYAGPLLLATDMTLTSTTSGAITLNGKVDSVDLGKGLTINTGGLTSLNADIGTTRALSSLSTDAPGSLSLTAANIITSGGQTYREPSITVGSNAAALTTLISTSAGDLRLGLGVSDHLDGPGALQLETTANAAIAGIAGGNSPLASLVINQAKTIDLHDVTTTNQQVYNATDTITTHSSYTATGASQPISFNGPLVISDDTFVVTSNGVVTFAKSVDSDSVGSPRNLTINTVSQPQSTGGDIKFLGSVGSSRPLGDVNLLGSGLNLIQGLLRARSLTADTSGVTQLGGGSVATTNAQTYRSNVALLADTTLSSSAGGEIAFRRALISPATPFDLAVNTTGATVFDGPVGEDQLANANPLKSLNTNVGGTVQFNGAVIRTTGAQSYGEQAILGADLRLQSDNAGAITLAGLVDGFTPGLSALVINTAGLTTFGGRVGSQTALTSITTDQPGTVSLNGGSITTVGDQLYNELLGVTLGADTVLSATDSAPTIAFAGPVNGLVSGQQSLVINTQGLTRFAGPVGHGVALQSLFTDGDPSPTNTVEVQGGSVTTTGFQTYGENVRIKAVNDGDNTRFIAGGPIIFNGPVDLDGLGQPGHLTIEAPTQSVSFAQDVGLQTPFLTVTVLTGDLNLNNATITVNGWDAINPNSFNNVPTSAAIALQGTRRVNSSLLGGIEGGAVFKLQNQTTNNSRWLVWSYAPWTNVQPTPTESLPNTYGVQYLTPYNVTMQEPEYVNGNQFLYLVDRIPPPPPEPPFVPFDYLLNALQPPANLRVPDPVALLPSLPDYFHLSSAAVGRVISFGEPSDDLLLASAPSEIHSDVKLGFDWLAQAPGNVPSTERLTPQFAQPGDATTGMVLGSQGDHDYTPAVLEFPEVQVGAQERASVQAGGGESAPSLTLYPIPLSRLIRFPTTPLRLEDLQISGYQLRSQRFVALPRNRKGHYSVPEGLRLKTTQRRPTGLEALGPDQGLMSLEVLLDQRQFSRALPEAGPAPVLDLVTIAVPTAFGTVINVDVRTDDLFRRTP